MFIRRKSIGKPELEQDYKRRNKLSKPLTNRSSTNLALLAMQETRSSNASSDRLPGAMPLSPKPSNLETRRDMVKTHVFDGELCKDPAKPANEGAWNGGVASMVSKFEKNTGSQQPLQQPKARRPFSMFTGRRPSLISSTSKDQLPYIETDEQKENPATSSEQIVEGPLFPPSRRASFQPGTATRKSSYVGSVPEEPQPVSSPRNEPSVIEEEAFVKDEDNDSIQSFDDGDDAWPPSSASARPETPNSLDYTHLGGLRLGSLQVVNGRASPAASEISRLFGRPSNRRQASSEYGSETGGDDLIYIDSQAPPVSRSRQVSWYSNGSVKTHTAILVARKPLPDGAVVTPPRHRRDASAVAAEYISELPTSPYELRRSTSFGSLPKIEAVMTTESVHSVHLEPEGSDHQRSRSSSMTTISHRSGSPSSLQSDTGSVLRTTTKKTEFEDQLFDDEAMGESVTPNSGRTPERRSLESLQSWHSPMKPDYEHNEAFESALEFQQYSQHGSPVRIRSPVKERMMSPMLTSIASTELLQPPQAEQGVKSDSGYSSNNSVRSLSGGKARAKVQSEVAVVASTPLSTVKTEQPQSSVAAKFFKPILKSRKTAPAAPMPTFKDIRPAPTTFPNSTLVLNVENEKEKAKPKKLQKRKLLGKKKSLFVQSVKSIDDLSTFPAISPEMSANLHIRSQEVPELERTFKTHQHIRNQASISTMDLSKLDLRFPSPEPESEKSLKAPKRMSSGGRRRSWFGGKPKEEEAKRLSGLSEQQALAMISDFGTVASSLGGSPYDLAHEKSRTSDSGKKLNPHNISTQALRQKSMFDDETAAEIARLRSSSIKERDAWQSRRTSFNDRGGIPGKNLRPTSMAMDAPPMPSLPMPSRQARRPEPEHHQQQVFEGRPQFEPEFDDMQPPLPPKHSPRPSFIEPENYFDDRYDNDPMVPPPPSHSPRPIDVSPRPSPRASPIPERQSQDPWAVQAAIWKARRQSAGEALKRQSWNEDEYNSPEQAVVEEPLYPAIPERNPTINRHRFAQTRHYSIQPGTMATDNHNYANASPNHRRPFSMLPSQQHNYEPRQHYNFRTQPYQQDQSASPTRPLPRASPRASPHTSRPTSRHSARSYASSLAEELHPENYADQRRSQPAPDFGRYSGGLGYGYEGKDKGFGGSAGTRTVSGKAEGMWKGVEVRREFGVDLGDVPVMGVAMPVENFRRL